MAQDDSELTFIRCPSCRSLVPSSATRCRMCGYQLKSEEGSPSPVEENAGEEAKSRVRQRTVSFSEDEFFKQSEEPQPEIEEAPVEAASVEPGEQSAPEIDQDVSKEQPFRLGGSPSPQEWASDESSEEVESSADDDLQDFLERISSTPQEEAELDDEQQSSPNEDEQKPKRRRRRRRRRKPHSEDSAETKPIAPEELLQEMERRRAELSSAPSAPDIPESEPVPKVSVNIEATRHEQVVSNVRADEQKVEPPVKREEKGSMKESGHGIYGSWVSGTGKVIAWVIDFQADSNGKTLEIREGRFFISGSKLREGDLVIADSSLSTPHCLVKASPAEGLMVQDLMSVEGTLLRRGNSGDYELITVPERVNHGDWLKFGQFEVMVCVVPN